MKPLPAHRNSVKYPLESERAKSRAKRVRFYCSKKGLSYATDNPVSYKRDKRKKDQPHNTATEAGALLRNPYERDARLFRRTDVGTSREPSVFAPEVQGPAEEARIPAGDPALGIGGAEHLGFLSLREAVVDRDAGEGLSARGR